MKKIFAIGFSILFAVMMIVNTHAAPVTRKSPTGYIGSAAYWAEADFSGTALISGSSTMKCYGGSVTGITSQEGVGQVHVKATLNAPSNYNIAINRTVYNTSEIVY